MISAKDLTLEDYMQYLGSPKRVFWINFLAGTGRGLGFILGTVLVITVVTFIIGQVLSDVPWIGELFRRIDDWLQQNVETYQPQ